MKRGGIRDQRSTLTAAAVGELAETYGIDLGSIAAANRSDRVMPPPGGWIGLYLYYIILKKGFVSLCPRSY